MIGAVVIRNSVVIAVLVSSLFGQSAMASPLTPPAECWIDNLTPFTSVGAEAQYVVNLSGGNGMYSVTLSYGDGSPDGHQTVGTSSVRFSHWFSQAGGFSQTATVASSGSQTVCSTTTSVQ